MGRATSADERQGGQQHVGYNDRRSRGSNVVGDCGSGNTAGSQDRGSAATATGSLREWHSISKNGGGIFRRLLRFVRRKESVARKQMILGHRVSWWVSFLSSSFRVLLNLPGEL